MGNMLLIIKKRHQRRECKAIYQYVKANNKCMKGYEKNKELSYLKYQDINNSYGRTMSQNLPVNEFKLVEETSEFNEDFIKNCNDESGEGYFLEVDV